MNWDGNPFKIIYSTKFGVSMYMRIKEIEVTWDGHSLEIIYNTRFEVKAHTQQLVKSMQITEHKKTKHTIERWDE
jgi:hypothetical protein